MPRLEEPLAASGQQPSTPRAVRRTSGNHYWWEGIEMEHDRNLRTLIPPLVLLTSLLWVTALETSDWAAFPSERIGALLAAVFAGGAAVVALGFLLSSASIWLLRAWSCHHYGKTIDIAGFSDDMILRFCTAANLSHELAKKYPLQCAAVYDHKKLQEEAKGLHEWAARRWNMFHVSAHCCLALVLAHTVWFIYHAAHGPNLLNWTWSWRLALGWYLPDVLLFLCLGHNALVAFRENRDLFKLLVEASGSQNGSVPSVGRAAEQAD